MACALLPVPAGGLLRKAWVAWSGHVVLKQRVAGKLRGAIFAMGGLKLARAFGWWRVLAAYLKHMKAAMMAIQDKVRGGGQ